MLLVLALCGCESADEKAERLRLENLYALDDRCLGGPPRATGDSEPVTGS